MDVQLARTFLAIVSTGSFVRASEHLHVAQTTVSARIRNLEQQLGRPLFVRHKGGASLTAAGRQFLRVAPMFVQLWQRTLQQVAVPPGHRAVLTIGSEISLAQPALLQWARWIRRTLRDIALRVHVDVPQDLINQVASGAVDIAIMYAPQHRPGLKIDLLMEEELVLVTTEPGSTSVEATGYVFMDWGPDFEIQHRAIFPDVATAINFDLGPLALDFVLSDGGSGYFRKSVVQPHLETGQLFLVPDAPQFAHPVYAVQSTSADETVIGPALAGLHAIANGKIEL